MNAIWMHKVLNKTLYDKKQFMINKSDVKRRITLGHLDQYMAQHGCIVKKSYCETVYMIILFNSN